MYKYGLIGNCNVSALIHESGSIDWLCLPRPDSEPIFGRLLDSEGGHLSIDVMSKGPRTHTQRYLDNTNILVTEVHTPDGALRITDFCPRFEQHGRLFRPLNFFRIVEPIEGSPTIKVACKPISGWSKARVPPNVGNSHIRFEIRESALRLTTNMPLTYLCDDTTFALKEKLYFCLGWNTALEEDLIQVAERFLTQTENYWKAWVKHCSIPSLFQRETIRSALTLKLHCFEDTGAILAALTTSLPEDWGSNRNWDYRFCWLRDSYFVLSAFHNLGHFEEMEGFLKFLLNIAHRRESSMERLSPVYSLKGDAPVPETIHSNWHGYQNSTPVRSNNQAAEHVQNDVYGEMILTLAPIFFDERFVHLRTKEHEDLLSNLAKLASNSIGLPDAGPWEVRDGWQKHSFTNLMCWAGLERLERIQKLGYLKNVSMNFSAEKLRAEKEIEFAVREHSLRNGVSDESFDAALSMLSVLRYSEPKITSNTLDGIIRTLWVGKDGTDGSGFFYRYLRKDDFGVPKSAFVVCSFWIAQALARLKRYEEARKILDQAALSANPLGLFSEHFDPFEKKQLGNFPQTYSHVGLINSAFEISPSWSEVL